MSLSAWEYIDHEEIKKNTFIIMAFMLEKIHTNIYYISLTGSTTMKLSKEIIYLS